MVGWSTLLRSTTARALVRRFSKDVVIAGTASLAATLVLSAVQDTAPSDGPPRPPADIVRVDIVRIDTDSIDTGRIDTGRTAAISRDGPATVTARHDAGGGGPRLSSGQETTRPAVPNPRVASSPLPAPRRGAAPPDEPLHVSPPLDLSAFVRVPDGAATSADRGDRRWTFGSSLRLARSAAETATSRVLEWKHRATTSTGSLLDALR